MNFSKNLNPTNQTIEGTERGVLPQTPKPATSLESVFTPRTSKVVRSPTLFRQATSDAITPNRTGETTSASNAPQAKSPPSKSTMKDEEKKWVTNLLAEKRGEMSRVEYATKLTRDLKTFIFGKANMHMDAKRIVEKVLKEVEGIKFEVEDLKKALAEKDKQIQSLKDSMESSTGKRGRPSPDAVSETPAIPKRTKTKARNRTGNEPPNTPKWTKVVKKSRGTSGKAPAPAEPKVPVGQKPIRKKSDALLIGAKAEGSYAEILRKMKKDPNLSDIGGMVSRVRKTRNGDMLLEFKSDG
jgi:hypothetical protein